MITYSYIYININYFIRNFTYNNTNLTISFQQFSYKFLIVVQLSLQSVSLTFKRKDSIASVSYPTISDVLS